MTLIDQLESALCTALSDGVTGDITLEPTLSTLDIAMMELRADDDGTFRLPSSSVQRLLDAIPDPMDEYL
ncbi:hypothetical protein [Rhodopirellula halodulae]|uniref:hypothetical protein n=1 Tax=Rhodopirellula halodulae TaxID=2894198 RepID=UPI001E39FF70|nr:hypothetical protein [Rhodopirellula sp. JC737]MCC9655611.1 hypothetical protein [Rhodopirellula sp. JC737]